MNPLETTAPAVAGLRSGDPAAAAVRGRANVFDMTRAAEEAVLRPNEAGAFPHEMRAAVAARIARLAGEGALADRHVAGAGGMAWIADPEEAGGEHAAMLAFIDKVANAVREVEAEDIARLRAGGMSDADIVRLCELVAFIAYQLRVVAGLRLMRTEP